MNPFLGGVFTFTTLLIAIPSAVKAFNYITTIWKGNVVMTPSRTSIYLQKGIEEDYVDNALDAIDYSTYKSLIKEEANKKHLAMGSPKDFNSKQKLSKYLNQKGFEGELIFEIVENL